MPMVEWCLDCNMEKTRCLCDQEPKVVRVMITVIYADNSSVLVDIKNPNECDISMDNDSGSEIPLSVSNYNVWPNGTTIDLQVKTKIDPKEPAIISVYLTGT